jgi:hypothetical protein
MNLQLFWVVGLIDLVQLAEPYPLKSMDREPSSMMPPGLPGSTALSHQRPEEEARLGMSITLDGGQWRLSLVEPRLAGRQRP